MTTDTTVLQDDLGELLTILGMGDHARAASPHEVFQEALGVLRERVAPTPRPLAEYHEDFGFVTWWILPVCEPAWVGSPNCSDWPGYHTHWTPHPSEPAKPDRAGVRDAALRLRAQAEAAGLFDGSGVKAGGKP